MFRGSYTEAGLPWGSVGRESAHSVGDLGSIPGWGRSPEGGNGNLLQYSCLGNRMDRGAWQATVRGVPKELDTTQRLNNNQILKDLGAAFLLS